MTEDFSGIEPESGADSVDAEMVARAEAAVAALGDNFSEWLTADVATASQALETARSPETAASGLETLYTTAHNIKGYSGTFGYELATDIADSLCLLLKRAPGGGEAVLETAASHVKGLDLIVAHDIAGSGGPQGEALMAKLRAAVDRALGEG
ncbi:MAG: Hpt domain-containing protein [Alphaproteobacteria bacterium]|jgi:hypothetical protein|nr:Hpt domain-containing protein [Alphaproteobacteria bacterium]